jgi:hypothetical protein
VRENPWWDEVNGIMPQGPRRATFKGRNGGNVESYRFGSQRLEIRQATVKAGLKTLPTS